MISISRVDLYFPYLFTTGAGKECNIQSTGHHITFGGEGRGQPTNLDEVECQIGGKKPTAVPEQLQSPMGRVYKVMKAADGIKEVQASLV